MDSNTVSLLATDRCDRCGAQALSVARKGNLEIMFCLHHIKDHFDALRADDWVISSDVEAIAAMTPAFSGA